MQLLKASLTEMIAASANIPLPAGAGQFLQRYELLEPEVAAFVPEPQIKQRIAMEAAQVMERFPQQADKPPLYGIPVGIKDLIHADGLPTRAGSALPPEALTRSEGSLLARLRALGAIVAGKTVTEEFAYQGPIATRNPHNPAHTPGGSSAGSAAAVAAGICPLAIGTQTLRSVIAPASFCGVVGYKPSYGRVPLDGIIRLAPAFDTIGFFTQDLDSMEHAAELLLPDWNPERQRTAGITQKARKPVLGIPRGIYMELMSAGTKEAFAAQIALLEQQGYQVKQTQMPWEDELVYGDGMLRLLEGEMAREHAVRFTDYATHYHPAVRDGIVRGQAIAVQELDQLRGRQLPLRQALTVLMRAEGIDLWVSPAQGGAAPRLEEHRTGWPGMTAIWTFAGLPELSLPLDRLDGLPLGFQCVGSYGGDETLFGWARMVARDLTAPQ